jgi:hypothetical protein
MIEVTRENFDILYTEIVDVIKKADFIGKLLIISKFHLDLKSDLK